ncbi:MAG: hypothetical protein DWQ10_09935 [Calditrichaeota bacterium]|nr:MAG: hypothetical protein DWQ10_09935 [Calditrichota bacterium]
MFFSDDFLESLKDDDPFLAVQKLCKELQGFLAGVKSDDLQSYNLALDAYGFLYAFAKRNEIKNEKIDFDGNRSRNIERINVFASDISHLAEKQYTEKMMSTATKKYNLLFGNEFYYELVDFQD